MQRVAVDSVCGLTAFTVLWSRDRVSDLSKFSFSVIGACDRYRDSV